ncbi:hypothetical protein LB559_30770 [Mesorhizobium sp. BR1-1-3]|uniref:hypothetical protein n=1 Tax=Mesorhizobium sp. BR1-1-3 TaxID=2876651 RepID=UPI001CD1928E|nr:hypothetical protein [Mesorhizobium sp. BR1-1-3]MBZ9892317.1 hypothetical protein [Mesorhizobium sp. BR1-1-3]
MTYTAEIAASIEAMRSAPKGTSLASKFSTTRMGHQSRHAPLPVRYTRTARKLAHYGAMTPEGCLVRDLQRARDNHRLNVDGIKAVLGILWSFRLLGWLPSDTNYLEYEQIVEIVASGTRRPRDTQGLMPVWFTRRHTVDELRAFGVGKGA